MWSEGNYDPKAVITSTVCGKLIYGDLLFMAKAPDTLRGENCGRHQLRRKKNDREASTTSAMKVT